MLCVKFQNDWTIETDVMDKWDLRVYGTPTFEVTLFTIWYIHPTHLGYTKVTVMVMNDPLMFLLLHVNLPSHSRNKAISNFAVENLRPWS